MAGNPMLHQLVQKAAWGRQLEHCLKHLKLRSDDD
jgi:hypothetical protein